MNGGVNLGFEKIITANYGDDTLTIVEGKYPFKTSTVSLKELTFKDKKILRDRIGPMDLTMDKSGNLLVINSYDDTLFYIDLANNQILHIVELGRCPVEIKLYEDNIYIINCDSNSISLIDSKTLDIIENIPVGNKPTSIEVDEFDDKIYITNEGGNSISTLDSSGKIGYIKLKDKPLKLKIEDNTIFILALLNNGSFNCSRIYALDRKKYKNLWSLDFKGVFFDFIKIGEDAFYLTNPEDGYLYELNIKNKLVEKKIYLGGLPSNIISHNKKEIYINDLLNNKIIIVDILEDMVKHKIRVGKEPYGILLL